MSNYAKRRSTQRLSTTSASNSFVKPENDLLPRSPQFGGDEDSGPGAGNNAALSGGSSQYEDADGALKIGGTNAVPRVSRSAFDERVRSVRDRLREMMASGGGDGERSSDGSDIECDPPPDSAKKLPPRGSIVGRASASSVGTTTLPDDESVPSSNSTSSGRPQATPEAPPVTAGRRRSHSILLDNDVHFDLDGKTSARATSSRASAGQMPPPAIASDSPPRSPVRRTSVDVSGQPVIGRDIQARVGLRIRVVDPKVARCVEPTGIIKEIRCEGMRVRVEHDGKDNPQRYYNTGKGGEHQLVLEAESDEELTGATAAQDVTLESRSKPRMAKPGSHPSHASPEPPQIIDDEDELQESESKVAMRAGPRRSRYSEIRSARRTSKSLPSSVLDESAPTSGQIRKSKAAPSLPLEQASSLETAPRQSSNINPTAEPALADNVQSVTPASRTKHSVKKRSSMPNPALEPAPPASDPEAAPVPKRYAERRSSVPSPARTGASDPEAASAPKRYSERRRATASSPPSPAKLPQAPTEESESHPTALQEAAPRQKRYSEKRKSMRLAQAATAPTANETPEIAAVRLADVEGKMSPKQQTQVHQSSAGDAGNAASVPEEWSRQASKGTEKADELVEKLTRENEAFLNRLKNVEETLSRDLKAMKNDMEYQIGAVENRIIARVLEELENRIRQGAISAAGKIVAGTMDAKTVNNKLKSLGQLDMDACSEPAPQGIGTPVNEEPEQELMAGGDVSDGSASTGSRRGSDAPKAHSYEQSPPKCFQKPPAEVSNAELADNRQRLENIGNAARRVSASLGGGLITTGYVPESVPQFRDGLQTPDFAAVPSCHAQCAPPLHETPDNLDEEMEHLAEMRRFASSVLNHANALTAGTHPQDHTSPPHANQGGSMPPAWADRISTPRMSVNRSVGQPPESHLQAARRQSALREAARTDVHTDHFNPPSRGFELHAQPPPQPPPVQPGQAPSSSMQQWMSGARNGGRAGARRSTSTPMRVPWSSTGAYEAEGDGATGGRLVF